MEEPAQKDDGVTIPIQSGDDVPNVNPVQDKTESVTCKFNKEQF